MAEKMKNCTFCNKQIPIKALNCCYCGEWVGSKNKRVASLSGKGVKAKNSWLSVFMFFIFAAGVFAMAIYENNANNILDKTQGFERDEKYDTATLGYKAIIERWPFSYASIGAKEGLNKISRNGRVSPEILNMKIGETGNFDPYKIWVFPFVACFGCGITFVVMVISRLGYGKNPFPCILLAMISWALFAVRLVDSGKINWKIKIKNSDIEVFVGRVMSEPQFVFIGCYVLIAVCFVLVLSPRGEN